MSAKEDVQFLALLVHRGYLDRSQAETLLPHLKSGEALDDLLTDSVGWDAQKVARLRRTRAGEEPEIPGYEILERLGTGGTADVFRARSKSSSKPVALKVLRADQAATPRELKAFVDEARILERLEHPGLVKGLGVARSGETYFARLELVEGLTLLEHLDEGHRFDEDAALRIILEVAEVLSYMSSQGYVHRDVKPGNIMLSHDGRVKLIDLGFCAAKDAADAADCARGTVQYLSPEQAEGGAAADIRSDVYSLGVTLFQLLVGHLPFEGDCNEDTLRMHVMERLSSPELKSRGLSPHVQYFIEKMMSKDAELRYQSWEELVDDVRGQVEGRATLDFREGARVAGRSTGRSASRPANRPGARRRSTRSSGRRPGRGRS